MSTVQIVLPSGSDAHIEFYTLDEYASSIISTGGATRRVLRLPTDPIGTTTATFSGVPAGSEIRVYRADGVELAGVESAATDDPSLTWAVYAPGANSVNRIVVIALAKEIVEFSYTPSTGTVSIPIQMTNDRWYTNP